MTNDPNKFTENWEQYSTTKVHVNKDEFYNYETNTPPDPNIKIKPTKIDLDKLGF